MDTEEILLLNSCLDRLTEGWDEEGAQKVIAAFRATPASGKYELNLTRRKKSGGNVTGYTEEHGDVSIRDDQPQVSRKTLGQKEENLRRVGQYKIKRVECGSFSVLIFNPFFKSDLSTASPKDLFVSFQLYYLNSTLEPVLFEKIINHPRTLSISRLNLTMYQSEKKEFFRREDLINKKIPISVWRYALFSTLLAVLCIQLYGYLDPVAVLGPRSTALVFGLIFVLAVIYWKAAFYFLKKFF